MVVVFGTTTANGVPKVYYKHDTDQTTSGGREQEASNVELPAIPGGPIHLRGMDGWAIPAPGEPPVRTAALVEAAFSESYDPDVPAEPSTHTFEGYCEWFHRTAPPGKKLKMPFPGGSARCENVTIYRLDRTVQPPKKIKIESRNRNVFLMREWVNPHDYPVTISPADE